MRSGLYSQVGNLLPVTLGNIIGGAICMAGVYALVFGRASRAPELSPAAT